MNIFLYILLGFVTGTAIAGIVCFLYLKNKNLSALAITNAKLEVASSELKNKSQEITSLKEEIREKTEQFNEINRQAAEFSAKNDALNEKLDTHKIEIEELRKNFNTEFENIANKILDEKTQKFTNLNEEKISIILNPLKEKIGSFEKSIEEKYTNERVEKASLRKELEQIMLINKQMSDDTQRLTSALKGDKKLQGDWGEYQLELLLEQSGLQKGIHFFQQPNFKTEEGLNVRPDYVIQLPDNKQYIVDSKISLVAYEQYFNCEDETQKKRFLKDHIDSIIQHVNGLGNKNYQNLYGINSPDFVFMYFALEPALHLAIQKEPTLFEKAFQKNIVLVSNTTLLATMRTVSFIWKQENQKNNVIEIAKESGLLYDKFVGFTEDMLKVGRTLEQSKESYSTAMNKLCESSRQGDTIIGRMQRIKQLGANATKSIDKSILNRALGNAMLTDDDHSNL